MSEVDLEEQERITKIAKKVFLVIGIMYLIFGTLWVFYRTNTV